VFYDQLSPHGYFVDEPVMGHVFIPNQANFVPYTVGHWQYTTLGFVWVSNEPFAWATSHYGRWAFSRHYGRWVWLPDTVGPAWVSGADPAMTSWAPLAPEIIISTGYECRSTRGASVPSHISTSTHAVLQPRARRRDPSRCATDGALPDRSAAVVVGPPPMRQHKVVDSR
jgi:hypothetical protein